MSAFLRIHNLTKTYREGRTQRVVLREASATFRRGESVAIVGKSGSGKSTLLNLISGIDRPDSGGIFLDAQELTRLDERSRTLFRRRKVGFIFQFFNLIPTLKVGENVTLPLELNGVPRQRAIRRAQALLAEVGLAGRWEAFPESLSGGEQQRVAIARALVHEPLLILADEPTGNLDEESSAHILHLLTRLTRENRATLLMVTHNPEVAASADRTLRLHQGKLHPF